MGEPQKGMAFLEGPSMQHLRFLISGTIKIPRFGNPQPQIVPLLMALWSLLDGIWGVLKGSWGVLVDSLVL